MAEPAPAQATYWPVMRLATGGMGLVDLVYRGEGRFGRLFAQKRLRPELRANREVRAMFLDEARVAGLIRHPNVVPVVDVGEDEGGPFLVADWVDGWPLGHLIAGMSARGEAMPVAFCVDLALQIAAGLHAAHELETLDGVAMSVVHRDVTPQNVLVDGDGFARLTDFSIAKAWGRLAQTAAGAQKGKVGYMSPEQLRFEPLDRRADLFALGVVLYETLAGRRLYEGQVEREVARRILQEPPPDIGEVRRDVPDELVGLLFELLAKDPQGRPQTAAEVRERLRGVRDHVVALEGGCDAAALLDERFGHERKARAAAIRQALSAALAGSRDR